MVEVQGRELVSCYHAKLASLADFGACFWTVGKEHVANVVAWFSFRGRLSFEPQLKQKAMEGLRQLGRWNRTVIDDFPTTRTELVSQIKLNGLIQHLHKDADSLGRHADMVGLC